MDTFSIIKGTVAIILIVIIPGYALTLAFFKKKEIDVVERMGLSFLLGLIPYVVLYGLNKNVGLPINSTTTLVTVLLITALGVAGYLHKS